MLAREMECSERGIRMAWEMASEPTAPNAPGAVERANRRRIIPPHSIPYSYRSLRSLRLAVQDTALSRRKQGFDSPRERQSIRGPRRRIFPEASAWPEVGSGVARIVRTALKARGFPPIRRSAESRISARGPRHSCSESCRKQPARSTDDRAGQTARRRSCRSSHPFRR